MVIFNFSDGDFFLDLLLIIGFPFSVGFIIINITIENGVPNGKKG